MDNNTTQKPAADFSQDHAELSKEGTPLIKKIKQEAWDFFKVLLISLAIVFPIRYFIVQPFIVRGASMEPNFEDHQYLIIDEISYYLRNPMRGEVVVFHYPRDPSQYFIKRIVGLPGETVKIRGGRIAIVNNEHADGLLLDEEYLDPPNHPTYPDMTTVLGNREYFVLGDNRDHSSDSRIWGILPRNDMVGRTLIRVWPFTKFGIVAK